MKMMYVCDCKDYFVVFMLYNIPYSFRKTSVKSKKKCFFRVLHRVISPKPIQKNDISEVQEEINEIQEPDRQRNRQEKSRMVCTTRRIKELN
jgi:hypothetical protein